MTCPGARRYNAPSPSALALALQSPLYRHVISQITQKLESGEWRSGDTIPSEPRLAEQFEVSVGTIRKAIDELVAGQILIRHQGRGTFVSTHSEDHYRYHFFHIVDADGTKRFPAVELLAFRRGRADGNEAAKLGLKRGAPVIRVVNLLRLDDEPVVLDHITIGARQFPGLSRAVFVGRPGTIYHLYQERYGVSVIRAVERLRAVTADGATGKALGVRTGDPLLEIERLAYTYRDRPVELRVSQVSTEHHAYLSELGKGA